MMKGADTGGSSLEQPNPSFCVFCLAQEGRREERERGEELEKKRKKKKGGANSRRTKRFAPSKRQYSYTILFTKYACDRKREGRRPAKKEKGTRMG